MVIPETWWCWVWRLVRSEINLTTRTHAGQHATFTLKDVITENRTTHECSQLPYENGVTPLFQCFSVSHHNEQDPEVVKVTENRCRQPHAPVRGHCNFLTFDAAISRRTFLFFIPTVRQPVIAEKVPRNITVCVKNNPLLFSPCQNLSVVRSMSIGDASRRPVCQWLNSRRSQPKGTATKSALITQFFVTVI